MAATATRPAGAGGSGRRRVRARARPGARARRGARLRPRVVARPATHPVHPRARARPAPRAVPSDAAGVALGWLLGAGPAQALVLWGTLVLAGVGAARLGRHLAPGLGCRSRFGGGARRHLEPVRARAARRGPVDRAAGYAAVPHLMVSVPARAAGPGPRCGPRPSAWRPAASAARTPSSSAPSQWAASSPHHAPGGRRSGSPRCPPSGCPPCGRFRQSPSGVTSSTLGVAAFAARADTPLGVLGSLVSGGAFWNPASHPASREVLVLALAALVLALVTVGVLTRAARQQQMLAAAGARGARARAGVAQRPRPLRRCGPPSWSTCPAAGCCATPRSCSRRGWWWPRRGAGVLVRDLLRLRAAGPALAVLVAALPVALLPSLAWGVGWPGHGGRRCPPTSGPWRPCCRTQPPGHRRACCLVAVPPLRVERLPGLADPRAPDGRPARRPRRRAAPGRTESCPGRTRWPVPWAPAIARGAPPLQALADEGCAGCVVEKDTGLPDPLAGGGLPPTARVVRDGPTVSAVELAGPRPDRASGSAASGLGVGRDVRHLGSSRPGVSSRERCGGAVAGWYSPRHGSRNRSASVARRRHRAGARWRSSAESP